MYVTPDQDPRCRPRLVLAHTDAIYAAVASRYFRQCGWEVYLTEAAPQVRRLTREMEPVVVALDVDLREQSGWLTCYKLRPFTHEHWGWSCVSRTAESDVTPAIESSMQPSMADLRQLGRNGGASLRVAP